MARLTAEERRRLPDTAFAYIDSRGNRRLPIYDEPHTRNALARFDQVVFESDVARTIARSRLLAAAKKYGIVPIGFLESQLEVERTRAVRRPDDLPTGTITLMFTDVEGSTPLLESLGDTYAGVMERVRRVIRRAVREGMGRIVEIRADESFSVFTRAASAIGAAAAIQRRLARLQWPEGVVVRVRIGLHHGSVTVDDAGYVGLAVHTAARIAGAAHGGQVLVSQAVRTAAHPAPTGVGFRSLGAHRLAGLRQPMEILQVEADGLGTEFPPLRRGSSATKGRSR